MAEALIEAGAGVHVFDPEATENFLYVMDASPRTKGKVIPFEDKYECLKGTSGLVTMTEWREFQGPDLKRIKEQLLTPVIFDARNLYETEKVLEAGFDYFAIGKNIEKRHR